MSRSGGDRPQSGENRSESGVKTSKARGERSKAGVESRKLAIEAMVRIEKGGAYANIVLPDMLAKSALIEEDRRFVTQLVYGATRMKRACDHLVDRFLLSDADDQVRAALRIGAFQLVFLQTPAHAAVDATVSSVSGGGRKVVNAVLRRVAKAPVEYPSDPVRLSYPDWITKRMVASLGQDEAMAALEAMNQPATTSIRDDGYVQDPASQLVVETVAPQPGELVVDLCAAPGGKATGMAARGARVIAGDKRLNRVGLVVENVKRLGSDVDTVVADGRFPPLRPQIADRVLIDAPCSGFGSLRRRPDARWRIDPQGPARLGQLQYELVSAGLGLLKPGGVLTYSVCTFGDLEGRDVIDRVVADRNVERVELPTGPWRHRDGMAVLLPDESDGMMLAQLRVR